MTPPPAHPTVAALLALSALPVTAQLAVLPVAGPFDGPIFVVGDPSDAARLFVGEQAGSIRLVVDGVARPVAFLDIGALVSSGGERGLLDMAPHPSYPQDPRFFVHFTDLAGDSMVIGYERDASDPDTADPTSAITIFGPLPQPFANHNGGSLNFGGDGKLYLSLGDGGAPNDAGNPAQNGLSLLGKILRFDVDLAFPHIPRDNPFVGDPTTRDEIWALGLRNPWRTTFDRETGDLWITDVGLWTWEEVDFSPASSAGGENYGWGCMEGDECTGSGACVCNDASLTPPVHTYDHALGCSITGGYRYRGDAIPGLVGRYFFADYCAGTVSSFAFDGGSGSDLVDHTADLEIPGIENFVSFGEDANGELYLVDQNGGEVWRIVPDCPTPTPYCTSSPNSVGPGASMGSEGATSVTANDFSLTASDAIPGQFGIFFYGPNQIQLPFGEGLRCVDGGALGTFRLLPPQTPDETGTYTRPVDFDQVPANGGAGALLPGSVWNFQLWYRDPAGGPAGFNLSNGLTASFCP